MAKDLTFGGVVVEARLWFHSLEIGLQVESPIVRGLGLEVALGGELGREEFVVGSVSFSVLAIFGQQFSCNLIIYLQERRPHCNGAP